MGRVQIVFVGFGFGLEGAPQGVVGIADQLRGGLLAGVARQVHDALEKRADGLVTQKHLIDNMGVGGDRYKWMQSSILVLQLYVLYIELGHVA